MSHILEAIFEDGVFRPLGRLSGIPDRTRVRITVEPAEFPKSPLADCFGALPKKNADEMMRIVEEEFERIDPREW